jgi:hypothetical protein
MQGTQCVDDLLVSSAWHSCAVTGHVHEVPGSKQLFLRLPISRQFWLVDNHQFTSSIHSVLIHRL